MFQGDLNLIEFVKNKQTKRKNPEKNNIVKILCSIGLQIDNIDVNIKDSTGTTPLMVASFFTHRHDHDDIFVKLLLERKDINVNLQNMGGDTALMHACKNKNENGLIVSLLLERKDLDVNLQNNEGETPLLIACCWVGRDHVVKLLLERKDINVNLQDNIGQTALINACKYGFYNSVGLLLKRKDIKVNIQDNMGETALFYITRREYYFRELKDIVKFTKLFLARGAIVDFSYTKMNSVMQKILNNRRIYLPRWNRFTTYRCYPKEFNNIAFQWLLVCKRLDPKVSKDMKYLLLEYIAEVWKKEKPKNAENHVRKKSRKK